MRMAPRRSARAAGILTTIWLTLLALLPAPRAAAHATLLATTPPAGYAVATAPRQLILDFDEPVSIVPGALTLTGPAGKPAALAPPTLSVSERRLSAEVRETLPEGAYQVHWQVHAEDGDLVDGSFSFSVGTTAPPAAAATSNSGQLDVLTALLRWLLFAGLALSLGGAGGALLAARIRREAGQQDLELTPVPAPLITGAALGLVATVGLAAHAHTLVLTALTGTAAGRVLGIELVAFAVALALGALARAHPTITLATGAGLPLLAVIAAEAMRAHPHEVQPVTGAILTATHLLAAALWVGGLAQVLRTALRWRGAGWSCLLVYDYARIALVLLVVVVATGTVQALLLVPAPADLVTTGYGRVLLTKIALVLLVIVCAALSRRRLRLSRITQSRPVGRAVRAETAALAAVLPLTAVLVSLAPPTPAGTALAAPPPLPSGPVVPVGTLAGQITVTAAASTGQLVVRLTTPGEEDSNPPATPDYRLAGTLRSGQPLNFRGCGGGCFTAPLTWTDGDNTVALSVSAPPWPAGAATLDIPWPPRPDTTRLPQVITAMRAVPTFTLREAVTSDYHGDPGGEEALPITGPRFIVNEPYAAGIANAVALGSAEQGDQLAFAFPAQGYVIRLWLAPDNRIVREVLVTPNHLITRTFDYGRAQP